jgi:hypothetical protein
LRFFFISNKSFIFLYKYVIMNYPGYPIQVGAQNDLVKAIQEQLNVKGFGPLKIDGDFGAYTLADVEAFQKANHLSMDGVVGPQTWDALFRSQQQKSEISSVALEIITSQIGQKEIPHGSNSGPMVNEYLHSVGLDPGYPWCQALVFWSYNQAALLAGKANPVVRTGGVMNCWNSTVIASKIDSATALKSPKLILPGYQMILDFGGGVGHTGLVESLVGTTLITIEGNSNTDGSRDGEMVVRQSKRTLNDKTLKGFISY